jgi:hypothetical protein
MYESSNPVKSEQVIRLYAMVVTLLSSVFPNCRKAVRPFSGFTKTVFHLRLWQKMEQVAGFLLVKAHPLLIRHRVRPLAVPMPPFILYSITPVLAFFNSVVLCRMKMPESLF